MTQTTSQYCSFYVGDLFFGVDVTQVQEVIRYQEMTPVPLAAPAVAGLINLRGQIVTAIDLRRQLAMAARAADELPVNVVVVVSGDETGAVSLLVDRIGDVLLVEPDTHEAPPQTLRGPARAMITGVHKLDKRLLLVLNTRAACSVGTSPTAPA